MSDVTIITENGEKKSFHVPEITAIVGCSVCGHIFRDRDTKMTMVRSQHIEKWIPEWNPKYISATEYLVKDEETGFLVKKEVKTELKAVHGLKGVPDEHIFVAEKNPEAKYVYRKVDLKRVEYTCMDCLNKPVTAAVKDMKIVPSSTLEIADQVRTWRETYGARLVMLGFGRPVDAIVEMVCQKLRVKFQEAQQ